MSIRPEFELALETALRFDKLYGQPSKGAPSFPASMKIAQAMTEAERVAFLQKYGSANEYRRLIVEGDYKPHTALLLAVGNTVIPPRKDVPPKKDYLDQAPVEPTDEAVSSNGRTTRENFDNSIRRSFEKRLRKAEAPFASPALDALEMSSYERQYVAEIHGLADAYQFYRAALLATVPAEVAGVGNVVGPRETIALIMAFADQRAMPRIAMPREIFARSAPAPVAVAAPPTQFEQALSGVRLPRGPVAAPPPSVVVQQPVAQASVAEQSREISRVLRHTADAIASHAPLLLPHVPSMLEIARAAEAYSLSPAELQDAYDLINSLKAQIAGLRGSRTAAAPVAAPAPPVVVQQPVYVPPPPPVSAPIPVASAAIRRQVILREAVTGRDTVFVGEEGVMTVVGGEATVTTNDGGVYRSSRVYRSASDPQELRMTLDPPVAGVREAIFDLIDGSSDGLPFPVR